MNNEIKVLTGDAIQVMQNIDSESVDLIIAEATYATQVSPEDVAAYLYATLAHPAYQQHHEEALLSKELRVPFTKNPELFTKAVHIGKRLLWLQTYGERFSAEYGTTLPQGTAQCRQAVTGRDDDYPDAFSYDDTSRDIVVGEGKAAGRFGPVDPEVWSFEVSGFAPVQSWLGYRMKNRKGKKSSPLDDIGPTEWSWEFTSEFLQLLWVLEHTLASYPEQAELLDAIESGPFLLAEELPEVPDAARKPPRRKTTAQGDSLFDARQEDKEGQGDAD